MSYPHYSVDCYEHWPTVTICGSMRFYPLMLKAAERLTLEGKIVLMPFVVKRTAEGGLEHPPEVAEKLDVLHQRKIDLSRSIAVVSDGSGYFGESTASEIAYATTHDKSVIYIQESAQ